MWREMQMEVQDWGCKSFVVVVRNHGDIGWVVRLGPDFHLVDNLDILVVLVVDMIEVAVEEYSYS